MGIPSFKRFLLYFLFCYYCFIKENKKNKEWNAIVFIFSSVPKADNHENRELKKPKSSN